MAVSHNNPYNGNAVEAVEALYTVINGLVRYTVIASDNIGSSNGWFVFKLTDGTWEMWIGARAADGATWHANNYVSTTTNMLHYAFAPAGGWSTDNGDLPSAVMFSDSPLAGTYWAKIRRVSASFSSTAVDRYFTVIDNVATETCIILFDFLQANAWDVGLGVFQIDPRLSNVQDAYPFVVLSGTPNIAGVTSSWLSTNGVTDYGVCLKPGEAVEAPPYASSITVFDGNNQPNAISGSYDTERINIRTATAGLYLQRGKIKGATLRQVLPLPNRTILASNDWIVPCEDAGLIIPWTGA